MARRKKEPEGFHRAQIAAAAGRLFAAHGTQQTTMDDVAREAGYSKATVYVYFQNKQELVGALTLESMKLLHLHLRDAVATGAEPRDRFFAICRELVRYQKDYPFYFETALGEINVDFSRPDTLAVDRETFEVGEQINAEIGEVVRGGMDAGVFCPELDVRQTVFALWASLSGLILLAANKQAYLQSALGISKEVFLQNGFALLCRAIEKES